MTGTRPSQPRSSGTSRKHSLCALRWGVTAYMKDMVTLLLENRPEKPIEFINDYFTTVLVGSNSNPLTRALRFVRLSPVGHPAFEDNLVAAYAALDGKRGHVAAGELQKLTRLLCSDAPLNISRSLLVLLDKRDADPVSYAEFGCAVRTSHFVYTIAGRTTLARHASTAISVIRKRLEPLPFSPTEYLEVLPYKVAVYHDETTPFCA